MTIKIKDKSTVVFAPEIDGNETLPEDQQFRIELQRPSQLQLQREALSLTAVDESPRIEIVDWTLSHIKRLINPPKLDENGKMRDMRVSDIRIYDELFPIYQAVQIELGKLYEEDGDPKNS